MVISTQIKGVENLTLAQAAKMLGRSRQTLYDWAKDKEISKLLRVEQRRLLGRKYIGFDEQVLAVWKKHLPDVNRPGPVLTPEIVDAIKSDLAKAGL